MNKFLQENGADEATISKVTHLIGKHEVGGDLEQDILMDADSVSFFETNAEMFVKPADMFSAPPPTYSLKTRIKELIG